MNTDKNLNNLETKSPDYELFTEKYSDNQSEMCYLSNSNSIEEIPKPNMLRKAFELLDIYNKWEDVGLFIDSNLPCIAQANSNKILLKNKNVLNYSDVLCHEAIHVAQMNQNDSNKPVLDREDAETEANSIARKVYAGKKASVSRTRCHELQYTPDEQSLLDNYEEIKKYLVPSDEQDDPIKVERKMKELKDWYKQKFNKNGMADNPLCRYADWMRILHILKERHEGNKSDLISNLENGDEFVCAELGFLNEENQNNDDKINSFLKRFLPWQYKRNEV